MEYSYELFPQLDTVERQDTHSMMELAPNQHRNAMFYTTEQCYYYYPQLPQQQIPQIPAINTSNNAYIYDSEDILFPSTVNQPIHPVYNNQITTATSSSAQNYNTSSPNYIRSQAIYSPSSLCCTLKNESPLSNGSDNFSQQQNHYTYTNAIDMSILTPPTETYDIQPQQLFYQQSNILHVDPLPVTFDSNQIKAEPYSEEDTKTIYQANSYASDQCQNSISSISSPSSCFSSISSFAEGSTPLTTPSRPTPLYQCEYKGCTKTFTRTYNLKSHRRTHTDEKPFACDKCSKAFARQHDRNRHAKLHLGLKPYPCQFCDKSFARQDALNRHLKRDKKGSVQRAKKNGSSVDFPPPCLLIKLRQKALATMKKRK